MSEQQPKRYRFFKGEDHFLIQAKDLLGAIEKPVTRQTYPNKAEKTSSTFFTFTTSIECFAVSIPLL